MRVECNKYVLYIKPLCRRYTHNDVRLTRSVFILNKEITKCESSNGMRTALLILDIWYQSMCHSMTHTLGMCTRWPLTWF